MNKVEVGFNKMDLALQDLGVASGSDGSPAYTAINKALGKKAILDARNNGATFLRVSLGLLMVYVAANLLFGPGGRARVAIETLAIVAGAAALYGAMRVLGRKWMRPPRAADVYQQRLREAGKTNYQI